MENRNQDSGTDMRYAKNIKDGIPLCFSGYRNKAMRICEKNTEP